MHKTEEKTVVVLGMHRSGTSLLAGVLEKLGIHMGGDLLEAAWTNPLGHFEDKGFMAVNERILADAGGSWYDPPSEENLLALKDRYAGEIQELLARAKSDLWGWKDPRTALTVRLYLEFLKNPYFIAIKRDEKEVAESLKRRNSMDEHESRMLTREYVNRIEKLMADYPHLRFIELNYSEIIAEPEDVINRIIAFLGISPDKQQVAAARQIVMPREKIAVMSRKILFKKALSALPKSPRRSIKNFCRLLKS